MPLYNQSRLWRSLVVFTFTLIAVGLFVFKTLAQVPTPLVVNLTSDTQSGVTTCQPTACTLRAAIEEANRRPGPDVVSFNLSPSATIRLSNTLIINSDLTIQGPTTGTLTLDGNDRYRHFTIDNPSGSVNILNLTLANGRSNQNGGSISFTYQDSCFDFGCPDISRTLNLTTIVIRGGYAQFSGGAIYAFSSSSEYSTVNLRLALTDVALYGNRANSNGGGISMNGDPYTISIRDSSFLSNTTTSSGGAIHSQGGVVAIVNSLLSNNRAETQGRGGAILTSGGSLAILNSTLNGNVANGGTGGAIEGGGGSTLLITNSTLSGNRADNGGGALRYAGGSCGPSELINIRSSTITGNQAASGGGINLTGATCAPSLTLAHTILAGNTLTNGLTLNDCFNSFSGFTSLGYNLTISGTSSGCVFTGTSEQVITPGLFPQVLNTTLANNGGATPTHALLAGSPAINGGNSVGCTDVNGALLDTDQRGVIRIPPCDIGAYEMAQATIAVTATVGINPGQCATTSSIIVNDGTNVYYCTTVRNTGNVTLTTHTISAPALGINVTLPLTVAPGAIVSVTNVLIPTLGPVMANRTVTTTWTWTGANGGNTATQQANAAIVVPSVQVSKMVGNAPASCGSSSTFTAYAGDWMYYCLIVQNTSPFTLTQHAIQDPLLKVDVGLPFVLPPGAIVYMGTNGGSGSAGQPSPLGPLQAIQNITDTLNDTVNIIRFTTSSTTSTASGTPVQATTIASATVRWEPIAITRTIDTKGTDAVATRTITATVYAQQLLLPSGPAVTVPLSDRFVRILVLGGNGYSDGAWTNNRGQVSFTYISHASTLQTAAATMQQSCITDQIWIWVDLDGDGNRDNAEPWTFAERCSQIELASFVAQSEGEHVILHWVTKVEKDNVGFNLYRAMSMEGPYTKINGQLIGAQGNGIGASYQFIDTPPGSGLFYYQLEDLDTAGKSTLHGPVTIHVGNAVDSQQNRIYLPVVQQ